MLLLEFIESSGADFGCVEFNRIGRAEFDRCGACERVDIRFERVGLRFELVEFRFELVEFRLEFIESRGAEFERCCG